MPKPAEKKTERKPVPFEDVVKRLLNTPPPPKDWKPKTEAKTKKR